MEKYKLKKTWKFADYYDTTILLLALISVILVILGFMDVIDLDNPPYNIIDLMIWIVFIVDYLWRFFTSKKKFRFIIDNVFDLLAILPLNAIFTVFRLGRIFRLAKLTKLVKLTRLLRIIGLSGKLVDYCERMACFISYTSMYLLYLLEAQSYQLLRRRLFQIVFGGLLLQ